MLNNIHVKYIEVRNALKKNFHVIIIIITNYYLLFVTVNVSTGALVINRSLHQVNDLRQREPFAGY